MSPIQTLSSILGLAFASGVNLYAAVLMVGLGLRFHWISGLPGDLAILANPIVLSVAGLMYFLEFFADKIPFVSIAWDTIHTVIRPLGGAALALASASNMSPLEQVLAFLAGGSIALGTHSSKLGYRLLAHASPEPVSNSVFSLLEDFGVVGLVLLVYKHPAVAVTLVVIMLIGMALVLPILLRVCALLFWGLRGRLTSLFAAQAPVLAPEWLSRELGPQTAYRCFARSVPGVARLKQGYLVQANGKLSFATKGITGAKFVTLDTPLNAMQVHRGLLFDLATAQTGKRQTVIYFTKDSGQRLFSAPAQVGEVLREE